MRIPRRVICHAAAGFAALFIVAPVVYMRLDSASPVTVYDAAVTPELVAPGQLVTITWKALEHRACDGEVHRRFTDAGGVIFDLATAPTIYRQAALDEQHIFAREVFIPRGMAAGPAVYGGYRRYWCNPLQQLLRGLFGFEIVLPVRPIRFTVAYSAQNSAP